MSERADVLMALRFGAFAGLSQIKIIRNPGLLEFVLSKWLTIYSILFVIISSGIILPFLVSNRLWEANDMAMKVFYAVNDVTNPLCSSVVVILLLLSRKNLQCFLTKITNLPLGIEQGSTGKWFESLGLGLAVFMILADYKYMRWAALGDYLVTTQKTAVIIFLGLLNLIVANSLKNLHALLQEVLKGKIHQLKRGQGKYFCTQLSNIRLTYSQLPPQCESILPQLRSLYYDLYESNLFLVKASGNTIILLTVYLPVITVFSSYLAVINFGSFDVGRWMSITGWVVQGPANLLLFTYTCDRVENERLSLIRTLQKHLAKSAAKDEITEVQLFLDICQNCKIKFAPYRITSFNFKLYLQIFGTALSYLILMIQFRQNRA